MQTSGRGHVLPAGSIRKVILDGDTQDIKILSYSPSDSWTAIVLYPDGYTRQHQVFTINDLLDKITGQLRMRYNVASFQYLAVPQDLAGGTVIKIGGTTYA